MYHVKLKRFSDAEQVQIYEKPGRREVYDDEDLKFAHLILSIPTKYTGLSYRENPFNDNKYEWMKEYKEPDPEASLRSSRSRTVNKIYDIARSNMWEWFFTLTFNPQKVDSYNYELITKKLSDWLKNMRKKCPDMKYIVVPEKHKSGRWHFHGLFADADELEFAESGHVTESGQMIYNVGNYKLGFSTAIKLDGSPKVVSYLCKYITKEVCEATKGKKRYWASRNVKMPEIIDYDVEMGIDDILKCCDLVNARLKSVEGYINVNYIDAPIYSTNTCFSNRYGGFIKHSFH